MSVTSSPMYHPEMKCHVSSIKYDYSTKTGTVSATALQKVDMDGAVSFFKRLDIGVQQIRTYADTERSTAFRNIGGQWQSLKR